jgi:hypothetical protein
MNPLEQIMGVNDASTLWGLTPGTIKNYCAQGRVKAVKIEGRWVIDKNQPNPHQPDHPKNWRRGTQRTTKPNPGRPIKSTEVN